MKVTTNSSHAESFSDGCDGTFLSKEKKDHVTVTSKNNSLAKSEGSVIAEGNLGCAETHSEITPVSKFNKSPKESRHLEDAETLMASALGKKYKLTYNSWRNMKQRVHSHGAVIESEFQNFSDFLKIMGPRPGKEFTLDRLDNDNSRYGPDKCFWRDKQAQNNNKSTTNYLTAPDGTTLPLTQWAKITDQKANTMRKRKIAGWSDHEIIAGKRFDAPVSPESNGEAIDKLPWPGDRENKLRLESIYRENVPIKGKDGHPEMSRHEYLLECVLARSKVLGEEYSGIPEYEIPLEIRDERDDLWRIIQMCEAHLFKRREKKIPKVKSHITELGAKSENEISAYVHQYNAENP